MNRSKLTYAFVLAAAAALIMSPRTSGAQNKAAELDVCKSDGVCSSTGAIDQAAPRWYVILQERTEAFCGWYFEGAAKKNLVMPSPNNRFEVRVDSNHSYLYTDAEVQALLKHCANYLNLARKQWEADHPGQKAPY